MALFYNPNEWTTLEQRRQFMTEVLLSGAMVVCGPWQHSKDHWLLGVSFQCDLADGTRDEPNAMRVDVELVVAPPGEPEVDIYVHTGQACMYLGFQGCGKLHCVAHWSCEQLFDTSLMLRIFKYRRQQHLKV
jgi:hypothetical protein